MMSVTDVDRLYQRLGDIERKLDSIVQHGCAKGEQHADHEQRIRATEAYLARMAGAKAAIVVGGGVVGSILTAVGTWVISMVGGKGSP